MKRMLTYLFLLLTSLFVLSACNSHEHIGGERCEQKSVCEICGEEYGEPAGHLYKYECQKDAHRQECVREGCTYTGSLAAHTGGVNTCTSAGVCDVCGYEYLPKREHNIIGATCTKLGTCTYCGKEAGEMLAHQFTGATCTRMGTCAVCGSEGGNMAAHQYQGATCAKLGTCTACGAEGGEYSDKHDLPEGADACALCGLDYYSLTLNFTLSPTRDSYIVSGIGSCNRSVITVPATYKGLPVREVGAGAFLTNQYPDSSGVMEIHLPESVTKIGSEAFFFRGQLKTVTMPGVQEIGDSAFAECEGLENLQLPDSLIKIGSNAFSFCTSLREVEIPQNVTTIGAGAFYCCEELSILKLHDGIKSIGESFVTGCKNLESLYIPSGLLSIPNYFAYGCTSLKTVECGGGMKAIGTEAFRKCTSLEFFDFTDTLETISPGAFAECSSLTVILLPATVKTIDTHAFFGCASLRKLLIPSNVETIGIAITKGCSCLEFNTYKGMQYLGDDENPYLLFAGRADSLVKNITLHEDTRFVWPNVTFAELEAESIYWGKSVESYWFDAMKTISKVTRIEVSAENKKFQAKGNCLIETQTQTLLHGCRTSVIPNDGSIKVIGKYAFAGIEALTQLVVPDSVEKIDAYAFFECKGLEWIVIGKGVKRIERYILMDANPAVKVYYAGSFEEFDKIETIGYNVSGLGGNYELKTGLHFYSETAPTEEGNYWHYVDGVPTPWKSEE